MKSNIVKLFLLIWLTSVGCVDEDVGDCVACFTPPEPFWFEIVSTSADTFAEFNIFSDQYSAGDLMVVNETNSTRVDYELIDENDINLIRITSIGWVTEVVTLSVQVGGEELFKLYVDSERLSDDCCSFTVYNDIEIIGADFELDNERGVYVIFAE